MLALGIAAVGSALLYAFAVKPYVASIKPSRPAGDAIRIARARADACRGCSINSRLITTARVVARRDATHVLGARPHRCDWCAGRDVARVRRRRDVASTRGDPRVVAEARWAPRGRDRHRAEGDFVGTLTAIASLEGQDRLVRMTRIAIEVVHPSRA